MQPPQSPGAEDWHGRHNGFKEEADKALLLLLFSFSAMVDLNQRNVGRNQPRCVLASFETAFLMGERTLPSTEQRRLPSFGKLAPPCQGVDLVKRIPSGGGGGGRGRRGTGHFKLGNHDFLKATLFSLLQAPTRRCVRRYCSPCFSQRVCICINS
jgi:hypothetical protein